MKVACTRPLASTVSPTTPPDGGRRGKVDGGPVGDGDASAGARGVLYRVVRGGEVGHGQQVVGTQRDGGLLAPVGDGDGLIVQSVGWTQSMATQVAYLRFRPPLSWYTT